MKNCARTFGIVLVAAAVGAGVALILAPYSGEKTRRLIRFKAESYAKDLADEANARAAALYKNGADRTRRALKRLGRKISPVAA
jgi:gas vesicle protein